MEVILKIFNAILKPLWPLLKRFVNVDFSKQNWWNKKDNKGKTPGEKAAKKVESETILEELEEQVKIVWPTDSRRITSRFGWRYLNIGGKKKRNFHSGIDCLGRTFSIYACEEMIIQKVLQPDKKYPVKFKRSKGTWVRLKIPKGRAWTPYIIAIGKHTRSKYKYKHVDAKNNLKPKSVVKAGAKLGKYGNLGYSMGAHLHFEVHEKVKNKDDWKVIDPEKYLKNHIKKQKKQEEKRRKLKEKRLKDASNTEARTKQKTSVA